MGGGAPRFPIPDGSVTAGPRVSCEGKCLVATSRMRQNILRARDPGRVSCEVAALRLGSGGWMRRKTARAAYVACPMSYDSFDTRGQQWVTNTMHCPQLTLAAERRRQHTPRRIRLKRSKARRLLRTGAFYEQRDLYVGRARLGGVVGDPRHHAADFELGCVQGIDRDGGGLWGVLCISTF